MSSDVRHILAVLVPLPVFSRTGGIFHYAAPAAYPAGTILKIPFGKGEVWGVVWARNNDAPPPDVEPKPVIGRSDAPPLEEHLMAFVDWVARYTLSPPGAVLRMVLAVPEALEPLPAKIGYRVSGRAPDRLTEARRKILAVAERPLSIAALARAAGVSDAAVRGLIEAGALDAVPLPPEVFPAPDAARPGPALSARQRIATDHIAAAIAGKRAETVLLEGVTGAGKTEVYFEAIAETLGKDREAQILVLLPEIALTAQWLDRFEARFGVRPVQWHSGLAPSVRRRVWRAVASGEARAVCGARSALFLPFRSLRAIVADEEHDPSYKQEEGVIYNARDMAVVRGRMESAPVILCSATPSLETRVNAETGKYIHLELTDRHGAADLPAVHAIDLKTHPPERGRWLAPPLAAAIGERLRRGEQTLLFLNRRGYAPLTLCRRCGARIDCPHCSAWLVEHRSHDRLVCHHCGHNIARPSACPSCQAEDSLVACGPGIERIEEEVAQRWPEARRISISSDTLAGAAGASETIAQIESGAVDIVIGTQIMAKGHHFPKLTLVGVVDADLGLKGADLRGAERTWQQMTQVAGRAGRETLPGEVFLQTFSPEHPVVKAMISGDAKGFLASEIEGRKAAGMPPFGRLAGVIVSSHDKKAAEAACRQLAKHAPFTDRIQALGPAPAPLSRIRGVHRFRFLVKTARTVSIQRVISDWFGRAGKLKGVRIRVDIDPQSFL